MLGIPIPESDCFFPGEHYTIRDPRMVEYVKDNKEAISQGAAAVFFKEKEKPLDEFLTFDKSEEELKAFWPAYTHHFATHCEIEILEGPITEVVLTGVARKAVVSYNIQRDHKRVLVDWRALTKLHPRILTLIRDLLDEVKDRWPNDERAQNHKRAVEAIKDLDPISAREIIFRIASVFVENRLEFFKESKTYIQVGILNKLIGADDTTEASAGEDSEDDWNIERFHGSDKARKLVAKELQRYQRMQQGSQEAANIATWLDVVFSLPLGTAAEVVDDISVVKQVMNETHYGLDGVKREVLEHWLAAKHSSKSLGGVFLFDGPRGTGKAQPLHSLILTPTGWIEMGDVEIGDAVCTPGGGTATVEGIFPQGWKHTYKLSVEGGGSALACREHLWEVSTGPNEFDDDCSLEVISTEEMIERMEDGEEFWLPLSLPAELHTDEDLPLDPYALGLLLASGSFRSTVYFRSPDMELHEWFQGYCREMGCNVTTEYAQKTNMLRSSPRRKGNLGENPFRIALKEVDLWGVRQDRSHIPRRYLYAAVEARQALLQGICDSSAGTYVDAAGTHLLLEERPALVWSVKELISSLGGRSTVKNGELVFRLPIGLDAPFRLKRLLCDYEYDKQSLWGGPKIVDVVQHFQQQCQCIKLDDQRNMYITNDWIPTHNTVLAKSIARALGREAVVISMGGVSDPNYLNGTQRMYVGAQPGRVIQALREAETRNLVIIFDEIDKCMASHRGDPRSVLLELFDPNQVQQFRDKYVEFPVDLSQVMFICTSNHINQISAPLLDRMTVFKFKQYPRKDRYEIAKRFMTPLVEEMLEYKLDISDDVFTLLSKKEDLRQIEKDLKKIYYHYLFEDKANDNPPPSPLGAQHVRSLIRAPIGKKPVGFGS